MYLDTTTKKTCGPIDGGYICWQSKNETAGIVYAMGKKTFEGYITGTFRNSMGGSKGHVRGIMAAADFEM